MPVLRYLLCSIIFSFSDYGISVAQKDIHIDESLASHADKFQVKPGSKGFGKVWTIKFGDYAVIGGKRGWTTTNSHSNLLNTKTESKTTEKFSFTMANKTGDTAWVNAAESIETRQLNEIALFLGFSFGENELLSSSDNFTAFIRLNGDSSGEWALYMNITNHRDSSGDYSFFISNGSKTLFVSPIPDQKSKSAFAINAAGYGLSEGSSFRAALQYRGSGMMGGSRMFVWLDRGLDSKMKLALAAAMTSMLQLTLSPPESP